MDCNITRGRNNEILYVQAPNGEASNLFQAARQITTEEQALDIWKVGNSELYAEQVLTPQIEEYKSRITVEAPTVELIHRGKQATVNLGNLEYEQRNNTITTATRVGKERVILGRITTAPFRDGIQISEASVQDKQVYNQGRVEKIKGVMTQMFKNLLKTTTLPCISVAL